MADYGNYENEHFEFLSPELNGTISPKFNGTLSSTHHKFDIFYGIECFLFCCMILIILSYCCSKTAAY